MSLEGEGAFLLRNGSLEFSSQLCPSWGTSWEITGCEMNFILNVLGVINAVLAVPLLPAISFLLCLFRGGVTVEVQLAGGRYMTMLGFHIPKRYPAIG